MDFKKIFGILIIVFVLFCCVSAINASEQKTIEGMDFNMPDGYTEDTANEKTDFEKDNYACLIFTKGSDTIIINVNPFSGGKLVASEGEVEKTVNGIDGIYKEADKSFSYTDGNYLITISVPEESVLEDVIIGK